jgi:hypothetical protein
MTKEIKLTKGYVALVDDEDHKWLLQFKWYADEQGYARRNVGSGLKRVVVRMHREILQAPKGFEVDHINGNKFDNRRCNLRLATHNQNQQNCVAYKNNTSGFKGVTWNKRDQKWCAQIRINSKRKHIGYFDDPIEAAKAYDKAAKELHDKFAQTNFG